MGAVLLEPAAAGHADDAQRDGAAYLGLSFSFSVHCTDAELGRELTSALAPLRTDVVPSHRYTVVRSASGAVDVRLDGVAVAHAVQASWASQWLLWHVNRAVIDATPEHLLLHAGAVVSDGVGVLVPGAAGAGKSTLVAGLVQRGCGYLTDEVVALAGDPPIALPYPKALSLAAASIDALGAPLDPTAVHPMSDSEKCQVVADRIRAGAAAGRAPVGAVVVPRYRADAATALRPTEPTAALVALVTNAVNLEHHGAPGVATLAALAECGLCFLLEFSDLDDACRALLAALEFTRSEVAV